MVVERVRAGIAASATVENLDLLWGVEAIAGAIGRTPRQTFHMVTNGELPAKKVGGRWVVERRKLVSFFTGDAA